MLFRSLQNIDDTDEKQPEIKKRPSLEDDIDFDDWMRGNTRMKKKIRQMLDKEFDYSDPIKYIEKYLNSENMKEKLSSKPVEPQPNTSITSSYTVKSMDGWCFIFRLFNSLFQQCKESYYSHH